MRPLESYALKKRTDLRSAMANALADYLKTLTFALPRTTRPFKLVDVYPTWAQFFDRAVSADGKLPVAAVLPDRLQASDSSLTPRMMEETWEGGEPCQPYPKLGTGSGEGWALFTISEAEVTFVVVVRATNEKQREAIVSGIEDAFVEDDSLWDQSASNPFVDDVNGLPHPTRYGRLLPLPDYYDRRGRYTLLSIEIRDSDQNTKENRWYASFEFGSQAIQVVPRYVHGMRPRVIVTVGDVEIGRTTSG